MMPLDKIRAFNNFNQMTVETYNNGIPYFHNQFWTTAQRQGHSVQEISYRACFKPQLPEFFISMLTKTGDIVLDPFSGRGTTAIQACLMDRQGVGVDINPLSAMLTRPRLKIPSLREIETRMLMIPITATVDRPELSVFFHPDTLMRLAAMRSWFSKRISQGSFDYVDDWIRMVTMNRLTGHSKGFLSVYTLPPNQAVSIESQKKINQKRNQTPEYRDVTNIVIKKTKSLAKDFKMGVSHQPSVYTAPAWDLPFISDDFVDLTVTSPPFLDVVQYSDDNWLRGWFGGISTTIAFSQLKSVIDWQNMIRDVLVEQERVVKSGGYVTIEVGEVRSGKVLLEENVWNAANGLSFERLGVIVNGGSFTKTSNIWNITGGKGTNTNRIVILRKL